jgi:hypothetical protein
MRCFVTGSDDSGALHSGQRLAKPGLSGLSSNSSEQMAQTLTGKAITDLFYDCGGEVVSLWAAGRRAVSMCRYDFRKTMALKSELERHCLCNEPL